MIDVVLHFKKQVLKNKKVVQVTDQIPVSLPEGPDEITMRKWDEFQRKRLETPDWFREFEESDEEGQTQIVREWDHNNYLALKYHCGELLSCFLDVDLKDLLGSYDLTGTEDEVTDVIMTMYTYVISAFSKYKQKERDYFTHKGQVFAVPTTSVDVLGRKTLGTNLTTIEAVEALTLEHVLGTKDEDGNYYFPDARFRTDTAVVAALCRMVGDDSTLETMPTDFQIRRKWLDERIDFFSDLSFDVALDIFFFLKISSEGLNNIRKLGLFLRTSQLLPIKPQR